MHAISLAEAWTPEIVARALQRRRGLAWLDGDGRGPQGRWSFVACDWQTVHSVIAGPNADALRAFGDLECARDDADVGPVDVPEWIGWIAYDAAFYGNPKLIPEHPRSRTLPMLWWARYPALYTYDAETRASFVVGDNADVCNGLIQNVRDGLSLAAPEATVDRVAAEDGAAHVERVTRALSYIREGEIYQANLARRFEARFSGDPLALQLAMRAASPVPFGFYLAGQNATVISRTMECFLRWDGRTLETRPIKGTIARSGARDADDARALVSDDKERAEHSMIVDLMRNDLGRVAEIGSVKVHDLLSVEPYAALSHLVSTVRCKTREGVGIEEILRATFPPGSVTGTPKLRALQIIEELEACARGVYTGAVGTITRAGGMSLAVAIRTAVVEKGTVSYYAGGGIVSASIPAKELAETELKARVFYDALKTLTPIG